MHGGKLYSSKEKYRVKVGEAQLKYVDVSDPSKQHLKFHSRHIANYQAPAGVRERTIFLGIDNVSKVLLNVLKGPFDANTHC
jgi:hypothetical protein